MNEDIFKLVSKLNEIYEYNYNCLKPLINELIENNSNDINSIEKYLDLLLGIPTDDSHDLYMKLCNYYKNINKENADFYIKEYKKVMK